MIFIGFSRTVELDAISHLNGHSTPILQVVAYSLGPALSTTAHIAKGVREIGVP